MTHVRVLNQNKKKDEVTLIHKFLNGRQSPKGEVHSDVLFL